MARFYEAPSAAGPVANLDADSGDFTGDGPALNPADRINLPNVLQMQCMDRNANYAQVTVQTPDPASLGLYGQRKADPITNNAVQDPGVARTLLGIAVRRNQYGGDVWEFSTTARWSLLSPMDLITITDRLQSVIGQPARITEFNENDRGGFDGKAEPFVYGMCAPSALPATTPSSNPPEIDAGAGDVNAPIIFEPVPRLTSAGQPQLWVAVSSSAANYGGAQVYISTDGGSSYDAAGSPLVGSAVTGASTADWAAASDPDTADNLALDLTESLGVLPSYSASQRDSFFAPIYVDGGGSYSILYELASYNAATLTGTNLYTIDAIGSGNEIRRGVYAAPSAATGVDHPMGSRFALLSPDGTGILKLDMDPAWIGVTLHFKILSFNNFGSAPQSLSDVTDYTYTPNGAAGSIGAASGFQVNGA